MSAVSGFVVSSVGELIDALARFPKNAGIAYVLDPEDLERIARALRGRKNLHSVTYRGPFDVQFEPSANVVHIGEVGCLAERSEADE